MHDSLVLDIKKLLSTKRFLHSLEVAKTAIKIAQNHKINTSLAYQAGLLHDIAKEVDMNEVYKLCSEKQKKQLQKIEANFPKTWHAFAGPIFARNKLEVKNNSILSAIKWHTTGKANMSKLAAIIFIADYIEPTRKIPTRKYISELALVNIEKAVYATSLANIISLMARNLSINPYTIKCKNFYLSKICNTDAKIISEKILNLSIR
jgi:predicted HD superfamily hydrolase involved in NAD metabolism